MKTFLLILLCLKNSCFLAAQSTLSGTVYLYEKNGNNIALEGVEVVALGNSKLTQKNGNFSFIFDNQISVINLRAIKPGYEVINDEDIQSLNLRKKEQQHIYLDKKGNTKKREREFEDAIIKHARKKRDEYFSALEKGGNEAQVAIHKLELEAGKQIRTIDAAKSYISDRYGADTKIVEAMIPLVVRQNLDHSNSKISKLQNWILTGNVEALRKAYNDIDFKKGLNRNSTCETSH